MQNLHVKKVFITDTKCLKCSRYLNVTELFINGNYCIICKLKFNLKEKNENLDNLKKENL